MMRNIPTGKGQVTASRAPASRWGRITKPMIMLATISVVLFVFCLLAAGYPVLAEGPPDQESGGVSSSSKIEFNISQLLLDSISESGSGGIKRESVTEDAVTRDSGKHGKADASDASSGKATTGDELLSGITKDDFETSQTVGDLVRFDRWGNVEVYIHLASTDEESLQQVRDAVELVEIEGPEYGLFQAWVDPKNLKVVADLDAVKRITPPDYGHTERGTKVTEGDAVHRANLVPFQFNSIGYTCLSLLRASWVENRQSMMASASLRSRSSAATSRFSNASSPTRRFKHCLLKTLNSISAMFSQLP